MFVFAYANDLADQARHLRNLPKERSRIRNALRAVSERGRCEVIECPNATVHEVLDECQRSGDRLAVFHFAGHADGKTLLFEDGRGAPDAAGAAPLAEFLGSLAKLQLVVLNGCSTREQVEALLAQRVGVVVATSTAVKDDVATDFAERFYGALANSYSIATAFQQAAGAVKVLHGILPQQTASAEAMRSVVRDVGPEAAPSHDEWPWTIHGSKEAMNAVLIKPRASRRLVIAALFVTVLSAVVAFGAYTIFKQDKPVIAGGSGSGNENIDASLKSGPIDGSTSPPIDQAVVAPDVLSNERLALPDAQVEAPEDVIPNPRKPYDPLDAIRTIARGKAKCADVRMVNKGDGKTDSLELFCNCDTKTFPFFATRDDTGAYEIMQSEKEHIENNAGSFKCP